MSRYFVILGSMRTGSNLLETSLAQFAELACHGEAFNPAFPGRPRAEELLGWRLAERDADPVGFLRHLAAATPGQIPGFRLFDGHSEAVLAHVLADPDCARIVLTRDPLESWVSLQIARATDQWMLRNPAKRVEAKVRFEAAAFEAYRTRIRAFYAGIRRAMQEAGTTAFEIDYADLKSREVIEGAARHIGARVMPPRIDERIARQNPGSLAQKLENPEDLAAFLGTPPAVAEAPPPPPVEPAQAVLSRVRPLIFLPVPGTGSLAALAAMERMDHQGAGTRPGPVGTIQKRMAEGEGPFDTGLGRTALAAARTGRVAFALVRHPAARAYGLFVRQALPGPDTVNWVRQALTARFGALPSLRQIALGRGGPEAEGHDLARQREMFGAFLDLVAAGLAGTGPALAAWAPQAAHLAGWAGISAPDRLVRLEDFAAGIRGLGQALGDAPLPPAMLETIAAMAEPPVFPSAEVIDAALAARCALLWPGDYAALGYAPQIV